MNQIKMIAIDLDGTLLDDQKNVSEYSVEVLKRAINSGIQIVPITGRNYNSITFLLEQLPGISYAILMNGAQVLDLANRQILYSAEILPEEAEKLFDYLDKLPVLYDCFQNGEMWTPSEQHARISEYTSDPEFAAKMKTIKKPLEHFREAMRARNAPSQKIQVVFRNQAARDAEIGNIKTFFPELTITNSLPINIEITGSGANKGSALRFLCRHLDIPMCDVMAIGDSENDISMFQLVGVSVAMGNAAESIKACATYVTDSNMDSGAAKAIKRYLDRLPTRKKYFYP